MAERDEELLFEVERLKSQRDILIRNSEDLHEQLREVREELKLAQASNNRLGKALADAVTNSTLKNESIRELRMELSAARSDAMETQFWKDKITLYRELPWWKRIWRTL